MNGTADQPPVLWTPDDATIAGAELTKFAAELGCPPHPYEALHRRSIANPEEFWGAFWDYAGIVSAGYETAFRPDPTAPMTGARFFPDARLNYAENMLAGDERQVAVIEADETGAQRSFTRGELRRAVARAQRGLAELGVEPGHRVAAVLPNTLDALVALLAATSLGAVWSSCAPEFGLAGLYDRFGQISPRLLIGASSYRYNGTDHPLSDKLVQLTRDIPSLQHLVMLGDRDGVNGACATHGFDEVCRNDATEPHFPQLPFDHPLYIVYTSGTTGLPKCIIHRAGGVLLTHRKEHLLHCDIRSGDRVFYYSNTAWMMYHWHISALASGATVVLYDGAPVPRHGDQRDVGALWQLAESAEVTHFGTSPKYLSLLQKEAYAVGGRHNLSALRMIMSAGAPLTAEQFQWVYDDVKADQCLASISGGTEILGCFVLGNPTAPVRAGEIQGPALGMAVGVMDERNAPLVNRKGDLVCTEPFPSMPLGFWGDGGWERYLRTYFRDRNEIWTHGDVAEVQPSGGLVIYGRTDTLLKPGGVRIGTAEIYRVVEALDEVADSLIIGYPTADDMELWLFVVPADGIVVDESLAERIRVTLRREASPRHVPRRILQVTAVPYTLNGKKVEKSVVQLLTGQEVANVGSLANPEALDAFAVAAGV